jgi:uncharacterized protein (DUF1330 family)
VTPIRNPSPNPTSAVNPSAESITALAGWPDDNAIAMVNLLKYDGAAGRQAYGRYAQVAAQTIAARGGSLIYLGPVVAPPGSWDSLAIVRYPRRAAFLDMQNDPAYQGAVPDRTAGLSARLLYPFALADDIATDHIQASVDDDLMALNVTSSGNSTDPQRGTAILRLAAGGPGLVADDRWAEMRLVTYRSVEAWESDMRTDSTGLSVLTRPGPTV